MRIILKFTQYFSVAPEKNTLHAIQNAHYIKPFQTILHKMDLLPILRPKIHPLDKYSYNDKRNANLLEISRKINKNKQNLQRFKISTL